MDKHFVDIQYKQKGQMQVLILIGIIILVSVAGGVYYLGRINNPAPVPQPTPQQAVKSTPTPSASESTSSADMANWKTFTLENITFKYPPDWKDPEYIKTESEQSAEIKNQGRTQRIIVLSGVNKGYTEQELYEFINTLVAGGAEKLILDGSEAAKDKVTYQGTKTTTVYVTSKDKTSQYSISLNVLESYSDQEIDKILNQILSTFKFIP